MKTREQILGNPAELRNRARGVLCGLAIGDSFGDMSRKPENQLAYGMCTDFRKGESWSTDDTEFAILTAVTLIRCRGNLTDDEVLASWLEHVATQDELKRGGASEFEASRNLRKGIRAPLSGRFSSYAHSDGAAMRIAPVGIVCAGDIPGAISLAEVDAHISHDREGIWGAQSVAAAVAAAMADASFDEIFDAILLPAPKDTWYRYALEKAFEIVDGADGIADAWMPLHDVLWTSYKAAVCEALPQAFGALRLSHANFRAGLTLAGNFGRDADTIGAICGAVLGAKFGYDAIPAHWAEKPRYPSGTCLPFTKGLDILQIADALSDIALERIARV